MSNIALNKKSYKNIFSKYFYPITLFVKKIVVSTEDAEDVVHNLFMSLWEKEFLFNDEHHLKSFLFKSAYNRAVNYIQKNCNSRGKYTEFDDYIYDESNYLKSRIDAEISLEIMKALNTLPPKCREVFSLSYLDGMSVAEVASKLGISENTVKTQRLKAKKILQEKLKDLYPLYLLFLFMH